jgi:hypothetical protein
MLALFLRNYKRIRENERKRDRGHKVNKSLRPKLLSVLFIYMSSKLFCIAICLQKDLLFELLKVCFNYVDLYSRPGIKKHKGKLAIG